MAAGENGRVRDARRKGKRAYIQKCESLKCESLNYCTLLARDNSNRCNPYISNNKINSLHCYYFNINVIEISKIIAKKKLNSQIIKHIAQKKYL